MERLNARRRMISYLLQIIMSGLNATILLMEIFVHIDITIRREQ
jgi:hypothetical protein